MAYGNEDDKAASKEFSSTNVGVTIREESMEDFSPDWCQRLLNDRSYAHTNGTTRKIGGPSGPSYNSLMAKTLATDNTVRAMRSLYKPPNSVLDPDYDGDYDGVMKDRQRIGGEVVCLISLGDDVCSHTNVLHGGIVTTIIDQVGGDLAAREIPDRFMGANFNVNMRKSVMVPGIVLARAWVERPSEGRKVWTKVVIEQNGVTCVDAEVLYLKVKMTEKL